MTSDVVSIRIPRELKKKMERLRPYVKWSDEIRRFIESKVEELNRKLVLEEIRGILSKVPETKRGTAAKYVRDDRDSN